MEFPSNSKDPIGPRQIEKKEEKVILKVVDGNVKRRKKPLGARFMETFFEGANLHDVIAYVARDILVPAAKEMVSDALRETIDRTIFGESRSGRRSGVGTRPSGIGGFVSYNRIGATSPRREESRTISRRARAMHNFEEIILTTRGEADEVLEGMYQLFDRYKEVSVAELYQLVDVPGDYTDEEWGWTEKGNGLRGARVHRLSANEYLLDLPQPEQLK